MNNMLEFLAKSSDAVIALIGIIVSLFAIIGAFRAGVLKRVRFGSFELQASWINEVDNWGQSKIKLLRPVLTQ